MRKLKQITTGRIYIYTEALAKRKDMVLIEDSPKPKKVKRKVNKKVKKTDDKLFNELLLDSKEDEQK